LSIGIANAFYVNYTENNPRGCSYSVFISCQILQLYYSSPVFQFEL